MSDSGKKWYRFNPFTHNGFVLGFAIVTAMVIWVTMSYSQTSEETPRKIQDVPIVINLSEQAQSDELKVFSQTQKTVDVFVSGNASAINRLTADDFVAETTFSPDSTKVTGASMQSEVLSVKVQKAQALKDFQIVTVEPSQITVEYDRVKKITLPIENEIKYQVDSTFYAPAPSFSETNVVVSGPESVVNKIKRAAIVYEVGGVLKQNVAFSSAITFYAADDVPLTDTEKSLLTPSTDNISVGIPVAPKKTVPIELNVLNRPEGFADSRIEISPNTIEIAAAEDKINSVSSFLIDTPIDFAQISSANNTFDLDIPSISDVKNISNLKSVKVTFNLNGYKEAKFATSNIKLANVPSGLTPELVTKSLNVTIVGSEAQVAKLTGESVYCTADLENVKSSTGSVEVPVTVQINGANSCWAVGQYVVTVNMSAETPVAADAAKLQQDDAVATVQASPK